MPTGEGLVGLRRRGSENNQNDNTILEETLQRPAAVLPPAERNQNVPPERQASNAAAWRLSRLYCLISTIGALLAVITAPNESFGNPSRTFLFFENTKEVHSSNSNNNHNNNNKHEVTQQQGNQQQAAVKQDGAIDLSWLMNTFGLDYYSQSAAATATATREEAQDKDNKLPHWLRWIKPFSPNDNKNEVVETKGNSFTNSWKVPPMLLAVVDPCLLQPGPSTVTDLIDKILTSTPRLLAIANLLLALTFLLHTAVADWFLGTGLRNSQDWAATAGRERLGGFLAFKLLLISAVVAPDTLDMLILLSWYTLLSFLRSLAHLCAGTTEHTSHSGQTPRPGVLQLLFVVLLSDFLAAAVCVALFHGAGWGMVLLLTCDCALLAVDVICHILAHAAQVIEVQHSDRITAIEERQTQRRQRQQYEGNPPVENELENDHIRHYNNDDDHDDAFLDSERQIQKLEQKHARRIAVLDTTVFVLQLLTHVLTVAHFLHIWAWHGVQFTLIDGVLSLHLHSALSSASRKITERRNLHRIARDLDKMFENASDMDLRKVAAAGDVCCICLGAMTAGNVKKVGCGHLYHTSCLREVVERARSLEAARCPLCRASVVDRGGRMNRESADGTSSSPSNSNAVPPLQTVERDRIPRRVVNTTTTATTSPEDQALFRISTEAIVPSWLPIPNLSFEVVRRANSASQEIGRNVPSNEGGVESQAGDVREQTGAFNEERPRQQQQQQQSLFHRFLVSVGIIPMSPEEEGAFLEQLVDMFPQYDRSDLLRALRARGSPEAVAEAILLGQFTGVPRGGQE